MDLRSQARESRSSTEIPEIESRPEMEARPETEIEPDVENRAKWK